MTPQPRPAPHGIRVIVGKQRFTAAAAPRLAFKGVNDAGAGLRRLPLRTKLGDQKPQYGLGASSSPRKAPPTGAMITVMSLAGRPVSLRPM
jgi:hypothetical protein